MRARSLPDCPLDDVTRVELESLNDGPSSPASFVDVDPRAPLDLPGAPTDARTWIARGVARDGSDVALGVLTTVEGGADDAAFGAMFRSDVSCTLPTADGAAATVPAFSQFAVGASVDGALIAGGVDASAHSVADAIWIDARTAEVARVQDGLLRRRAAAAVTPLGHGFLVAGGRDDAQTWSDAEWIDTTIRPLAFERTPIPLSEPRSDAAAVLLSSGDALLVGGSGNTPSLALDTLQIIDATTRAARSVDLPRLRSPRKKPRAVRLATGEIAVLGGVDAAGAPVPDVDLLAADASRVLSTTAFTAAVDVDAIALPAGGVLVARRDGAEVKLSLLHFDGAVGTEELVTTDATASSAPHLVAGTDGQPLLWDGAWHRVDLWSSSLRDVAGAPSVDVSIGDVFPLGVGAVAAARSNGDGTLSFAALRFDVRNELSVDVDALGLGSVVHLVPDRIKDVQALRFLHLAANARVAITDTTYGAFHLKIGGQGRSLPIVELRTALGALVARLGDDACAYPPGDALTNTAEITRAGDGTLQIVVGNTTRACAPIEATTPMARVTITVVGGATGADVHGLTVTRG